MLVYTAGSLAVDVAKCFSGLLGCVCVCVCVMVLLYKIHADF